MTSNKKKPKAGTCDECHYINRHDLCSGTKEFPCGCDCEKAKATLSEKAKSN